MDRPWQPELYRQFCIREPKMEKYLESTWAKTGQSVLEHTNRLLANLEQILKLGYIRDERKIKLLYAVCEYHDYGKMNSRFQERILTKKKFNEFKEIPHNILSYFFINPSKFELDEFKIIACAVMYHHYHSDITRVVNDSAKLLESILDEMENTGIEPYMKRVNRRHNVYGLIGEKNEELILVKGLLHKCDYSASAGIDCEKRNDFLEAGLASMLDRWQQKNGNSDWKELQKFTHAHQDQNLIITASTGMGKTEAGLLWIGDSKGFFVLPLRTAINAMYDRIANEIIMVEKEERIALLHSDMQSVYLNRQKENEIEGDLMEYCVRSRQMSLPLTICTLDQIFDFVLKYPGYEYKLATLSYSKIVIDEIQMYDPALLAYLIYGVKWIHKMGGKIAVVTATLPPFVRAQLKEALQNDLVEATFLSEDQSRHHLQVIEECLSAMEIIRFCQALEADSDNQADSSILVVVNSIEIAQQLYRELSACDIVEDYHPKLLHSRFIRKDRTEKEREILKDGRTYDDEGNRQEKKCIWISTSIVEASLDIDFDYLFTELMDLMSLFQRLGRCNRKGIKSFKTANCFVFTEKQGQAMKYVDETIYQLSLEELRKVNGHILTEQQKLDMIENALSIEKLQAGKSDYIARYQRAYEYIDDLYAYQKRARDKDMLRNIQSVAIIPGKVYDQEKELIDENFQKSNNRLLTLVERIAAKEMVDQRTVSIAKWKFEACEKISELRSSKYTIPVVECDYDKEIGFDLKKDKKRSEVIGGII